jgi:serine/threonine protein kinase
MAQVYRARHVRVRRPLAVKVVFGDLGVDAKTVERFHREVEALSRVIHPHVVAIVDFGSTPEGLSYLVTELLEGATLDRTLARQGPFAPARAMAITRQMAEGLTAIHAQGIVHRDLKPQNVMLLPARIETAKILDFGIVLLDGPPGGASLQRLTSTGFFFGSPQYMAPEQAGRTNEDARADLYALGVILFEMLAGRPPFTGSLTDLFAKHAGELPPPLEAGPPSLAALVQQLLAKRPWQRPPSATAVVDALDSISTLESAQLPAPRDGLRPFAAGDRIADRFTIERPLGRGGMGVVFEAYDDERGERVALKTLAHMDPAAIYRLKKEFRSLSDLEHPNLIPFYELFSDGELWFFTMMRVHGEPFAEHVRPSGELDDARLRRAWPQLLRGVAAIHSTGKLHRDLKPANVLVEREGHLRILDFGLVRAAREEHDSSTDLSGGTLAYAAPEQLGDEGACEASDAYAAGVMLYEALTGALPFTGSARDVFQAKVNGRLPSAPRGPDDLAALAMALLHPKPEQRPSIAEIVARLAPDEPSAVAPAPVAPSGPRGTAFVGREHELATLMEAFDAVQRGDPRIVYVVGASGIGKTALVGRFLGSLRSNEPNAPVILDGRCYERESVPFKALDAVADALGRHVGDADRVEAARLLPRDASDLCRLFPALARAPHLAGAIAPRAGGGDPQEIRRRAFGALREMFSRIADRRPLVIAIDDSSGRRRQRGLPDPALRAARPAADASRRELPRRRDRSEPDAAGARGASSQTRRPGRDDLRRAARPRAIAGSRAPRDGAVAQRRDLRDRGADRRRGAGQPVLHRRARPRERRGERRVPGRAPTSPDRRGPKAGARAPRADRGRRRSGAARRSARGRSARAEG